MVVEQQKHQLFARERLAVVDFYIRYFTGLADSGAIVTEIAESDE